MIALLDPALFLRPGRPGIPLAAQDEAALLTELRGVLAAMRIAGADLAAVDGYWSPLWTEIIGPLQRRMKTVDGPKLLQELRKAGRTYEGLGPVAPGTRIWGFRAMFGHGSGVPAEWEERLAVAAARLVAIGRPLLVLTRLVEGRNLHTHMGKAHSSIAEVTRWRLSVRPPRSAASTHIPCVRAPSQIQRPWTVRFDPRLPTDRDLVRYPFCLPQRWDRRDIVAVRTFSSAPAWVDVAGRGWERPNIPEGRGHHWDVFLDSPHDVGRVGVDQLNIVEFGAPPREGTPGTIHHVPAAKAGRVTDVGWGCP